MMSQQPHISDFAKKANLSLCQYIEDTANDPINPDKIPLAFLSGDPTVHGLREFQMPQKGYQILRQNILNQNQHGYVNSSGLNSFKESIAKLYQPLHPILPSHIFITHGVNMGLLHIIMTMTNEGDQILVPDIGYPFYNQLCPAMKRVAVPYRLLKQKNFQIDLEHLKTLLTPNTAYIYIVNPGSPTGSVFSRQHMLDILAFSNENQLPIVVDQVYWRQNFPEVEVISFGELADDAPVIVLCGVQKLLSVPGWVQGWIAIFDKHSYLEQVRKNLEVTATIFLHTNTFTQYALPRIFQEVGIFTQQNMHIIKNKHDLAYEKLKEHKILKPIRAQGTFYLAVEVDFSLLDITNDYEFARLLKAEQAVSVLPLSVFGNLQGFRLLTCAQDEYFVDFFGRINQFLTKHAK